MTGILYLLNVACSSGQSTLGKYYAKKGGNSTSFNINKAFTGVILFLIFGLINGFSLHLPTVIFGIAYGISLCISMHTGFKALAVGPMALTSIIASFSLLIPFFFGICFWNESITVFGIIGIILLCFSIVFIGGKKSGAVSLKWLIYALATLLTNGICSIIQKFHQMKFPSLYQTEFMFFALLCVSVILSISMLSSHPEEKSFKFSVSGTFSGVLNSCANYIVLFLAATENASTLFPVISVANIAVVWLIGIILFKEKLTALQTIGLVLGISSIVLLKL